MGGESVQEQGKNDYKNIKKSGISEEKETVEILAEPKRIYANQMEIDSDLFKLEAADMLKNSSWNDKDPVIEKVTHCHFFRTYDSNGKKMSECNKVGGHGHEIKISVDENGNFVGECSPAKGTKFGDNHIHYVKYLRSDRVMRRTISEDASRYIAKMESYK